MSTLTLTSDAPGQESAGVAASLAAGGLLTLLVAAPVCHGSVEPLPRATLAALACGLGAIGLSLRLWLRTPLRLSPGAVPLGLFTLLVFIQTLPIGSGWLMRDGIELPVEAATTPAQVPAITMSRARECLGFLVVFVASSLLLSSPTWARRAAWVMLLLAGGLAVAYAGQPFLEIVPPHVPRTGHVYGTYLNRNHLAAFFVLALITGAGLFVNRRQTMNHAYPGFRLWQGALVLVMVITCAGLLLTASRGGFVSLVLGLLALGFLLARRRDTRKRWAPLLSIAAFLTVVLVAMPETLMSRFGDVGRNLTQGGSRPDLWLAALRIFEAFPLLGCGLGNFGQLSVLTQPDAVTGHLEHAHSDPLQFLAETGVVGLNLLLSAALLLGLHVLRRTRRTRGDRRTILVCGAAAAVFAFAVHSLIDFNFQVPGLTIWVAALAGLASGAMARANNQPAVGWQVPRWALVPMISALGVASGFASFEAWSAAGFSRASRVEPGETRASSLLRAHAILPGDGRNLLAAAATLAAVPDAARHQARIAKLASQATEHNPLAPEAHWLLGMATLTTTPAAAIVALKRAVALTPPQRRLARQTDAALAILASGQPLAARRWCHAVFAEAKNRKAVLLALHETASPEDDLIPLLPDGDADLLNAYASLLLKDGRLRDRERVLDTLLLRDPVAHRSTVRAGVHLVDRSVALTVDASPTLRVSLRLAVAPDHRFDAQLMCISALSAKGRFDHYFLPTAGRSEHEVPVPPHAPAGRYQVALQPYSGAARFPLGTVLLERRPLALAPGQSLRAEHAFHRVEVTPTHRRPETIGLELRDGVALEREVRLRAETTELALETSGTQPLEVRLDEEPLEPLHGATNRTRRYRIPPCCTAGRLVVRVPPGVTERLVRLTLLEATTR